MSKPNDFIRLPHFEFKNHNGDVGGWFALNDGDLLAINNALAYLKTAPDYAVVEIRLSEIDVHIAIRPPRAMPESMRGET